MRYAYLEDLKARQSCERGREGRRGGRGGRGESRAR